MKALTSMKTDQALLARLQAAAGRAMTAAEIRAQRVSWCVGQTGAQRAVVVTALAALTGCASTVPLEVKVPVPVECREPMPERPTMPTEMFTAKPALDEFVRAAQAEILRREGYEGKLRTALENCRRPITP